MKTRKMLAMLLSLAMVIGLMTPAAMAESLVDCPGSCTHEAEVGTTHYDTLSEAISEASAGATVTLLKDVAISEVNDRPIATKAVTIDGAGHTITYTGGRDSNDYSVGVLTVAGGTVKNLTIVGGKDGRALLAKNLVADLNVENCVLDGVYGFNTSGGSADYGIAFTDTTFDAWTSFDPVKSADFTDCTFNANFRPYSTVTLTDCILGADGVLDESKLQENNTITVSGTTTVNSAAALTSALKLASAGATIKLGTDVIVNDVDNRPIATKAVTIDGAGHTITYTGGRDSNDYSVGVLTVAGGTVKNLTIVGGKDGRALLAKNLVADLNVENCVLDGVYGFNTSGGSADYGIAFTDTTFDAWTSFDPVKSADFTDCTFNANFRPYSTVTLTDCTFGAAGTLDESKLKEGNTITVSGTTTVNSAAALTSALKLASAGATIKLGTDVIVNDVDNRPIATKAVTVDGAGNTIEYSGNRDGNGGSVGVLTIAGGTVKNLTIEGGENGRALLAKNLVADLKVENCNFSGAYGFNTSGGSADYGIAFTNTAFDSWTSYDPVKSADFTDCTFKANFRPYSTVTLTDCTFGATGTLDESKLKEGNTITVSGGTYSADPSKYVANGEIVKKISDTEYAVVVKSGLTAGTYMADPTGATADNHYVTNNNDGTWTVVYRAPSSGGNSGGSSSGGGSSSSSNTTTSTEKNPDGSTTTTTTNKTTGAVTETTKNPDGTTGVTKTDADGNVTEVSANVPAAAAKAAEKADEPVTLPVEIEAADNSAEATEIKVNVPASGATVEIPVENVTPGTVVVIVNADGTETIVPVTTLTEDGVVVTLEEDATVKVVDNSKDFVDVADDYALADSIDFVSARGLFEGNTETTFNPHANTTIAQTMTVLARLSGEDFYGAGSTAKGAEWAAEKGLSDGTDVNKAVTREQMVVMMWKLAGMPESDQPLTASDVNDISADALTAMQWAVEMGILKGNLDGTINPQGNASRAHVAAFTERYVNALAH